MPDFLALKNWNPPAEWTKIQTIDLHTGGEPLRVIASGLPPVKGETILAKRRYFRQHLDFIRRGLLFEPRGHADMYGAVITHPTTPDADFGTFFLHNEGYSTMCGHAIIALAKLVLDSGMIQKSGSRPTLTINAPPGTIYATAFRESGIVRKVAFRNVPSFVLLANQSVQVPGIGKVRFDVAYGGAFYALCNAEELGLKLDHTDYNRLIDYGRKIKQAVGQNFDIKHPFEGDLSFLYGTIFTGKALKAGHHSRNVCIFAEGEVDRSATGSGVSARAALHHANNQLETGEKITIESILGSTMSVEVLDTTQFGQFAAVVPEVSGTAFFTGKNALFFDPGDPLKNGFIFR